MLKNRQLLLLWIVNTVTPLAVELFTVTVLVAVFEQTGSTLQTAGAMVARTLPAFLLGPFAGVLVDRFARKNVLIGIDLLRVMLVCGAIWLLQSSDTVPLVAIYLITAGLAAGDTFHKPARLALIPSLVLREQLVRANSFILVSNQVGMAAAYMLGGWLTVRVLPEQIAWGVVFLLALAICAALLMVVPKRETKGEEERDESVRAAFMAGWNYLTKHPIARPLTIMETIEHLPHGIWTHALLLTFTIQALGGTTADWGYQTTGYFAGMIIGSIGALAISDWLSRHPGWIIVGTAAMAGGLTLAFAASPTVWVSIVIAFIFGPPFAVRDVAQDALLQATVEEGQLGRVYATREMLRMVVFMFAGLFFAWLADFMPIRWIFVIGGVMYVGTGIYALSNRALRESNMSFESVET